MPQLDDERKQNSFPSLDLAQSQNPLCTSQHLNPHLPHSVTTRMSFLPRAVRGQTSNLLRRSYATVSDVSGVKVAGIDSGVLPAATTSITVVVKAGTRYETQPGVAHCLKGFAFKVSNHPIEWRVGREETDGKERQEKREKKLNFVVNFNGICFENCSGNGNLWRCLICGIRKRASIPHC